MFADAEMQVATGVIAGLEVAGALEGQARLRGWRKVGRPADQPGYALCERIFDPVRRVAAGYAFFVGRERRDRRFPALRKVTFLNHLELPGKRGLRRPVVLEQGLPFRMRVGATLADAVGEVLVDAVRNQELRVLWPAVGALG